MTYEDLIDAIDAIGIDCSFGYFPGPVKPPYSVVNYTHNIDLMADGKNYLAVENYQIELYTDGPQPPTQEKIENLLKGLDLAYRKRGFLNEENGLFQTIYEISLIGG